MISQNLGHELMLSEMWEGGRGQFLAAYLFLGSSPSTLGKLASVVHGRSTAAWWLAVLTTLWVEHPPWTFPCPLILHSHKATVQRQVVPDWVLRRRERKRKRETVMTIVALLPVNSALIVYHHSANPHSSCFYSSPAFDLSLSYVAYISTEKSFCLSTNLHKGEEWIT